MNRPVTYTEIHSPDLGATRAFMATVFGWEPEPFATSDYLVADGGTTGVDTGLLTSLDGQPRSIVVIRVPDLGEAAASVAAAGGQVVVEPFEIAGVGRGCYVVDPVGVLIGLHQYDADAGLTE
ncbi:VOC family protein [Nocardioides sp. GXQ0305]|jgi:predicted enzyme related to lactoylglutathione lyase|uniref:VOC family protein n=1 Tax=Nocardioides sp. GXQ0305 TaxID=3423912 RepID=UPI003D7EB3A4